MTFLIKSFLGKKNPHQINNEDFNKIVGLLRYWNCNLN
jgi:hypothetical protein